MSEDADWRFDELPLFDWPRLDDPVERDPLREYDALGRNQPRRFGFMELVVRPAPWILSRFTGRVPDDFIAQIADGIVAVPCPCKAVTEIPYNHCKPCDGECGRWFWSISGSVRVAGGPGGEPIS